MVAVFICHIAWILTVLAMLYMAKDRQIWQRIEDQSNQNEGKLPYFIWDVTKVSSCKLSGNQSQCYQCLMSWSNGMPTCCIIQINGQKQNNTKRNMISYICIGWAFLNLIKIVSVSALHTMISPSKLAVTSRLGLCTSRDRMSSMWTWPPFQSLSALMKKSYTCRRKDAKRKSLWI